MVSRRAAEIRPLTPELLPALLDAWAAYRARADPPDERATWMRPPAERRPIVAAALQSALGDRPDRIRAIVATRGEEVAAWLVARAVRLPRGSGYRAYAPDHFLSSGPDEWGVADPRDRDLLARLYADSAAWGLARGADAHLLSVAAGDDSADLWLELGFARHDRYAFLPLGAAPPAPADVGVRRAAPDDLDLAAGHALAEARHHHAAPVFAFAPPGLAETKRRDMAESLADPESLVFLAEAGGRSLGGLSAFLIPDLPFWMPSATPTPCAYIDSAYVAPDARGRGILRALVATLAGAVAPVGARGLFVTYLPANRDATHAWQGLGFAPLLTVHLRRLDPRAVRQQRPGGDAGAG